MPKLFLNGGNVLKFLDGPEPLFGIPGIPHEEDGDLCLRLGVPYQHCYVRLGLGTPETMPRTDSNGVLYDAAPIFDPVSRRKRLARRDGWKGVIVQLTARYLHFGFDPIAPNARVDAGGEGGVRLALAGPLNKAAYRDELLALPEHGTLLIADRFGAILRLTCMQGALHWRPAARREVADAAEAHARRARTNKVATLGWGIELCEALSMHEHAGRLSRLRASRAARPHRARH